MAFPYPPNLIESKAKEEKEGKSTRAYKEAQAEQRVGGGGLYA